jgi:hypothetical protein
MYAIWSLVMREIHLKGAKRVSRACDAITANGRKINFVNENGELISRVMDSGTLRQWFYEAERARQDPTNYPILAHRSSLDLNTFPEMRMHIEQIAPEMRKRKALNEWRREYDPVSDRFID